MSVPSNTPQLFIESGCEALNSWPQLLMCDQQSGIISHVEHQSFKRPRNSETISNSRMDRSRKAIPYKSQLCLNFGRGNCNFGDSCHFAHGTGDIRELLPNRQELIAKEGCLVRNRDENARIIGRGRLCRWFANGEECPYGNGCYFRHDGLEEVEGDLGLCRKSCAISIVAPGPGGDCGSRFDGLERIVNWKGLSVNRVYQKPEVWKTRLCNKWETTGNCPYGLKCYFAHGQAELQKLGSFTALESGNISPSKFLATPIKGSSSSKTGIGTTYEQPVQGKKCLFKWKELEKISGIYGDWIDDMPLVYDH